MKNINEELGWFVGEYILMHFLPSLSIYGGQTRTMIQCTIGESDEYNRLHDIWYLSYHDNREIKNDITKEWIEHTEYRRALEAKYLPHELRCHLPRVTPTHMDSFLNGLIDNLWHSDVCCYHLEKDTIKFEQDKYNTIITLKLQTEWEPWK
jgi:hypothetical protein